MKEKTVYICEICNGTYATKEIATICENSGYPDNYDKFVGKWIIIPLQIFNNIERINESVTESKVIWFPARIESNQIVSPANYDFLASLKLYTLSHALKLNSVSFFQHNIIKNFLNFAIIVDEKYREQLNNLLVENEQARAAHLGNESVIAKVNDLMNTILAESNKILPSLEDVEKYEYKSSQ